MNSLFLDYVAKKMIETPSIFVNELIDSVSGIENVYLVVVDVLRGFCEQGALSSMRLGNIVKPIRGLVTHFVDNGLPLDNLIFLNDSHPENAIEFSIFPSHCISNTREAEVVPDLYRYQSLEGVQTFFKNATNGMFAKNKEEKYFFQFVESVISKRNSKPVFLILGDCTDLCIYQNAVGIKTFANEKNIYVRVMVSQSHVGTYHLSVEDAQSIGVLAHEGDDIEKLFLYHMKLNGIEVVSNIKAM